MYKLTSLAESVSLETPFVSKLVHLSFNKEESFGRIPRAGGNERACN